MPSWPTQTAWPAAMGGTGGSNWPTQTAWPSGAAPAWTPAQASPILWLEGDTGVTVTAGPLVTAWAGQETGASNWTASGALRPTTSATINGMPCVSFNGTTALQGPTLAQAGAKTYCIVAKLTALPGASSTVNPLSLKDSGSNIFTEFAYCNLAGYQNISTRADYAASGLEVGYSPVLDTNPHCFLQTYNGSGNSTPGNYTITTDSVAQTVVASGTAARTATDLSSIGSRLSSTLVLTAPAHIDIAGIWVFPPLSAANLTAFNAYRIAKYGV